jgi:hypothetical protein
MFFRYLHSASKNERVGYYIQSKQLNVEKYYKIKRFFFYSQIMPEKELYLQKTSYICTEIDCERLAGGQMSPSLLNL